MTFGKKLSVTATDHSCLTNDCQSYLLTQHTKDVSKVSFPRLFFDPMMVVTA